MNGKYFTPEDRRKIATAWEGYASAAEIAEQLGADPSTVHRELKRGNKDGELDRNGRLAYDPALAQVNFCASLRRRGRKPKGIQPTS